MASGIVLGFDFGLVRIGVSLGNGVTKSARPLSILDGRTNKAKWTGVGALIEQWQPELCVVSFCSNGLMRANPSDRPKMKKLKSTTPKSKQRKTTDAQALGCGAL